MANSKRNIRLIAARPEYGFGSMSHGQNPEFPEKEQITQTEPHPVDVLLPPPPQFFGFGPSFHRDPNHDHDAVQASEFAVNDYRESYSQMDTVPYPLRIRKARNTGLPKFLNGYAERPDVSNSEAAREWAMKWLQTEIIARALCGRADALERYLRYRDSRRVTLESNEAMQESPRTLLAAHAYFQQWSGEFPVMGGQLVVHLRHGDPRVSCTNSYFPLLDPPRFDLGDPMQARRRALRLAMVAVTEHVAEEQAIGLFLALIEDWLNNAAPDPQLPFNTEAEWFAFARRMIYGLSKQESSSGGKWQALLSVGSNELLDVLRSEFSALRKYFWQVEPIPYADKEIVIYPFAGNYYLAILVQLVPPDGGFAWRVWVDAINGQILGEPETHAHFANIVETSAAALQNPVVEQVLPKPLAQFQNEVAAVMVLKRADVTPPQVIDFTALPNTLTARDELKLTNIAFHAVELFNRMTAAASGWGLSTERATLTSPPFEVQALTGPKPFAAAFEYYSNPSRGLLYFRKEDLIPINQVRITNGVIAIDSTITPTSNPPAPSIRNLVLDREVILHEFIHAFMWQLNRETYEGQDAQHPFVFALREGYATLLARTFALRNDFAPAASASLRGDFNTMQNDRWSWARAAYRASDWQDVWSMARPSTARVPGVDLLAMRNIFPNETTNDLKAYQVGIIWARALWDVIGQFSSPSEADPNAYPNLPAGQFTAALDQMAARALNAFMYLHGWVSSFEDAAEGIVDGQMPLAQNVQTIKTRLNARGIYAEQGVQALAILPQADAAPFVGTDQSLVRWDAAGSSWINFTIPRRTSGANVQATVRSNDISALAMEGNMLYAATETDICKRALNALGSWQVIGAPAQMFPADQLPLSMLVLNGDVIVGTSNGVWGLRNGAWNRLVNFGGLAVRLAAAALNGDAAPGQTLFIATMTRALYAAQYTPTGVSLPARTPLPAASLSSDARITDIVFQGADLFVATAQHGVWRMTNVARNAATGLVTFAAFSPESVSLPTGIAINCMVWDRTIRKLVAGTTQGLYVREDNGTWTAGPAAQSACIITAMTSGAVLVTGTLDGQVWVCELDAVNRNIKTCTSRRLS